MVAAGRLRLGTSESKYRRNRSLGLQSYYPQKIVRPPNKPILSLELTWKWKTTCLQWKMVFQGAILHFHVSSRKCRSTSKGIGHQTNISRGEPRPDMRSLEETPNGKYEQQKESKKKKERKEQAAKSSVL